MNSKIIAIIPARGKSKRIPYKNIKPFLNVPIIKYSINAAIKARCFDEIMVSTDDHEIAQLAISFGANFPFYRSPETSHDYATTAEVLEEVIRNYSRIGKQFKFLCCIYATAPFVTSEKLKKALMLLRKSGADCVLPIVRFSYPIQRCLIIKDRMVKMKWPENYNKRSQDLETFYHDCGQFYFMRTKSLLSQKKLYAKHTVPFEINEYEAQDIDTLEDWETAELMYEVAKKRGLLSDIINLED